MTAVCTQVDDLDGKAHGAKIETILNAPFCKLLSYHGEEAMSSEEICALQQYGCHVTYHS